jgi:hypothetical protein
MRTSMFRRLALLGGLTCGSLFITLGLLFALQQRASADPTVCCSNLPPGSPPGSLDYRKMFVCENDTKIWTTVLCNGGQLLSECQTTCE